MAKKQKRGSRKNKQKKRMSRTKKMKGGNYEYTEDQNTFLENKGFGSEIIDYLQEYYSFDDVENAINQVNSNGPNGFHGNSDDLVRYVTDLLLRQNNSASSNNTSSGGKRNDEPDNYASEVNTIEYASRRNKTYRKKNRWLIKSRKYKGGMCFGTGVGANNNDPNFSIYNTRELQLFPYKPV
jgi:hypothetical protein